MSRISRVGGFDGDGKRPREVLLIRIEYGLETNMDKQELPARQGGSHFVTGVACQARLVTRLDNQVTLGDQGDL